MSPTLHVPRHFQSHIGTCSHADSQPRRPCQCARSICLHIKIHVHRRRRRKPPAHPRLAVAFATGGAKKKTLENCRRSQESDVEFMTAFTPAVGAIMTARYGDFTVMMNSSLRDLPCPAGCKMRTHTHTHTSLTLCSHNVPAWTQHAGAATLNIFLIHIETQN